MQSWPHKLAAVLALLGSIGVACGAQSSGSETPPTGINLMAASLADLRTTGLNVPGGIITDTTRPSAGRIRICLRLEISGETWSRCP
jgi:hypothetical protein